MPLRQNLYGATFGRLTAVAPATTRAGASGWRCDCVCGQSTVVATQHLTHGKTRSCGCLRRQIATARATRHGRAKSPEYRVWSALIDRCTNPRATQFADYGGRGIAVCQEWRESFAAFFADMGLRPPGGTIERINNDGPYSPLNCRWASRAEQGRNKRDNRWITWRGRTMVIQDWAKEIGLHRDALRYRLDHGWPVERAFTQPSGRHG